MSSVDERVVEMKFDKGDFQKGVTQTLSTLDKLKQGLKLQGASEGLQQVENKVNRFSMQNIADGVQKVASKFNALGAIGFSVLNNLTNKALNFGAGLLNQVLDPLIQGGRNRAENIEQAKFQFKGLGISVEEAMGNALAAVKGTAFGLDEAASAAGQLAASQIPLGKEMTNTLRAIAGVAAQTGSSYDDISSIFIGVAGNTRLMGDDLLQLSGRGINAAAILGKSLGKTEQDVREMVTKGKIDFATFRDAMDETFGKNAAKANETYSGALSNMRAALSRIGAAFQTPNLESSRRILNELAPVFDKVKEAIDPVILAYDKFKQRSTTSMVKFLRSLDFSAFTAAMGPLTQGLQNIVKAIKAIVKPAQDAFAEMFPAAAPLVVQRVAKGFREFTKLLIIGKPAAEGLKNTFKGLFALVQIGFMVFQGLLTIVGAIFSAFTGSQAKGGIFQFTGGIGNGIVAVRDFLAEGGKLQKFFTVLGKIIAFPIKAARAFGDAIVSLFTVFTGFDPSGIKAFFGAVGQWFKTAYESITSIDLTKYAGIFGRFGQRFKSIGEAIGKIADWIKEKWTAFFDKMSEGSDKAGESADKVGKKIKSFWETFKDGISTGNFQKVLDGINALLLGGVLTTVMLFVGRLRGLFSNGILGAIFGKKDEEEAAGIKSSITDVLGGVTDTLGAMQQQLKAKALLTIAIAIGVLAASLVVLSLIDSERLTAALVAITVMFGQLSGAMAVFAKVAGIQGIAKIPLLAGGLIVLGVAILILGSAVAKLSRLDWGELARGLTGVTGIIALMVGVSYSLNTSAKGMITAGLAMIVLGAGLNIMAKAVSSLASLDWGEVGRGMTAFAGILAATIGYLKIMGKSSGEAILGALALFALSQAMYLFSKAILAIGKGDIGAVTQGMAGIALILGLIAGFTRAVGTTKGLLATGVGLIAIAFAIDMLVKPVSKLGAMSLPDLAKGLGALAAALLIMGIASAAINPVQFAGFGVALGIVSIALGMLGKALKGFAKLSWEDFGKAIAVMASALGVLALAMYAMAGALPGAAALVVAALALGLLVPPLILLSALSWGEIGMAMAALGLGLLAIAVAGILLIPAIPGLVGLGVALVLIGVGIGAAALGLGILATGLSALGAAGPAAAAGITPLINLIPLLMQKLGEGIIGFATVIATGGPAMIAAFTALISSLLTAIQTLAPQIVSTISMLIDLMLKTVDTKLPSWIDRGTNILINFLQGIANKIPALSKAATDVIVALINGIGDNAQKVTDAGTNTVIKFINAIGSNAVKLANAGADAVVDFVNGVADAVESHTGEMQAAGKRLGLAVADGMSGGLASKVSDVAQKAQDLASGAVNKAKNFLGIHSPSRVFHEIGAYSGEGMANGLDSMATSVSRSSQKVGSAAVTGMRNAMSNVASIASKDINTNPTIRPVLDLSDVQKNAKNIGGLMGVQSIKAKASFASAKIANAEVTENRAAKAETEKPAPIVHKSITIDQKNTSPKALDDIEIYRQSKNALSLAASALDKDN